MARGWELSCCAACVGWNGAETQVIPDKVLVLFVASGQLKMFLFLDVRTGGVFASRVWTDAKMNTNDQERPG